MFTKFHWSIVQEDPSLLQGDSILLNTECLLKFGLGEGLYLSFQPHPWSLIAIRELCHRWRHIPGKETICFHTNVISNKQRWGSHVIQHWLESVSDLLFSCKSSFPKLFLRHSVEIFFFFWFALLGSRKREEILVKYLENDHFWILLQSPNATSCPSWSRS